MILNYIFLYLLCGIVAALTAVATERPTGIEWVGIIIAIIIWPCFIIWLYFDSKKRPI